jgi:hypothetical protein
VIVAALAQLWGCVRGSISGSRSNAPPAPEARAVCTMACTLSSGRPKREKRVAQQTERHLAGAHDGDADALDLEIGHLGCAMGPHRSLNVGVGLAGKLDDAPFLETLRNGEDQQPGTVDAGRLQDAGGRGGAIAVGEQAVVAESELAVLSGQCLSRRIPDRASLEAEVAAWLTRHNANHAKADWRFTAADARIKLKSLYPSL